MLPSLRLLLFVWMTQTLKKMYSCFCVKFVIIVDARCYFSCHQGYLYIIRKLQWKLLVQFIRIFKLNIISLFNRGEIFCSKANFTSAPLFAFIIWLLQAFANMTLAVKRALCAVMVFAVVDKAGTIVMGDGEELDSWSVIVNGHVEIELPDGQVQELNLGDRYVSMDFLFWHNGQCFFSWLNCFLGTWTNIKVYLLSGGP